jgi:hypothetical protein
MLVLPPGKSSLSLQVFACSKRLALTNEPGQFSTSALYAWPSQQGLERCPLR